jgi:hypothetical protein
VSGWSSEKEVSGGEMESRTDFGTVDMGFGTGDGRWEGEWKGFSTTRVVPRLGVLWVRFPSSHNDPVRPATQKTKRHRFPAHTNDFQTTMSRQNNTNSVVGNIPKNRVKGSYGMRCATVRQSDSPTVRQSTRRLVRKPSRSRVIRDGLEREFWECEPSDGVIRCR